MPRTTDPSGDLLFGLLALQNGIIDQDQLVIAFRAWAREKSRPMAEIMLGQGLLEQDDCDLIDVLVALITGADRPGLVSDSVAKVAVTLGENGRIE